MGSEITIFSVFLAGIASFLSPCVLPLVPPYLTYMAGLSVAETKTQSDWSARNKIMRNAACFVLGFSTVFIALGAGASAISALLRQYQDTLAVIAGIVIIAMGLHFLGIAKISMLYRELRFNTQPKPKSKKKQTGLGLSGSYIMGLAFAFGWTPCIGPVLGAVMAVAAAHETLAQGAGLLAIYSAGLGAPFLLAARFTQTFVRFFKKFRKHLQTVEKVMGALLVLVGILFLTGAMQDAAFFLNDNFPVLQKFG